MKIKNNGKVEGEAIETGKRWWAVDCRHQRDTSLLAARCEAQRVKYRALTTVRAKQEGATLELSMFPLRQQPFLIYTDWLTLKEMRLPVDMHRITPLSDGEYQAILEWEARMARNVLRKAVGQKSLTSKSGEK